MKKFIVLIMAITVCVLLAGRAQADSVEDPNNKERKNVTIELTKLDVNDTTLELGWKIKNNTDHDVWICDSIGSEINFEVYMAEDNRTLVIRRRLDVPSHYGWRSPPSGRYVRLHPGEIRPESLLLNLPVQFRFVYASRGTKVTKCARYIALEIGFYDEDLPALIRSILQEAEKFSGTVSDIDVAIFKDYFRGLWVRERFGSLKFFDAINKDPYSEGWVEFYYPYQALTGEKILRILVDGVSIPYDGYVLGTSSGEQGSGEKHQRISRNKDKPDLNEESDQSAVAKD